MTAVGHLYYIPNDGKSTLSTKIQAAIDKYASTYGKQPEFVDAFDGAEVKGLSFGKVKVSTKKYIQRNHFFVGENV